VQAAETGCYPISPVVTVKTLRISANMGWINAARSSSSKVFTTFVSLVFLRFLRQYSNWRFCGYFCRVTVTESTSDEPRDVGRK
jgi:hypothetical protein